MRAFYAQTAAPYPGLTPMMLMSMRRRLGYLSLRPATEYSTISVRPTVRAWTDASGVDRGLACVVQVGDKVFYTNMRLPDYVWAPFNDRGDHQIGCQEMIAVLLCQATFNRELSGARWLLWVDNRGVMGSICKGASKAPEVSLCVSRMWMQCARSGTSLHVWYVQSSANIADGPSRWYVVHMWQLKAVWREPMLPQWLNTLWGPMDFRR